MKRNANESFEEYKLRRKEVNRANIIYHNGIMLIINEKGYNRKDFRKVANKPKNFGKQDKFATKKISKRRNKS